MSEYQVALAHHKAGRRQQAKRAYEILLAKEPEHSDALHHLALIHVEEGDLARGVTLLRETVALQPGFPVAWYNLGLALGRAGEFPEAAAALQRVTELVPDQAGPFSARYSAFDQAAPFNMRVIGAGR